MKNAQKFNPSAFTIVRNTVTSQILPQINRLLAEILPRIAMETIQDWHKIITSGAEIFFCIHDESGDIAGMAIFLPINKSGDPYVCRFAGEVNNNYFHIRDILLENLYNAARPYINRIDWQKITITEAETWYMLFPNHKMTQNTLMTTLSPLS